MIGLLSAAALAATLQATPCEKLSAIQLPDTRVESATSVAEGVFKRPGPPTPGFPPGRSEPIPAHCRVTMVLTPSDDSNINVEMWLPADNWNGKLLAVGNGGWAGSIQGYADMQAGLRRGYVVVATDTGHSNADGPLGMFALGHPEKIVDFAYRAVHLMAVRSKQITLRFYDRPIDYSYFKGCSTGGRQALMSAQRYPGDFDGIIAGAPANRHLHLHTFDVSMRIDLSRNPKEAIDEATAKSVSDTILQHCDKLGEGFLNNPEQCHFDFSTLQCGKSKSAQCITPAQLKTVKKFYEGVFTSKGRQVFASQPLGNPMPAQVATNEMPNPFLFDSVRILGFQDANYDWRKFNLDKDLPKIEAAAGFINAEDPDLRAFKAHGGKLLMYHGWADPGISANNSVEYYKSVQKEMGGPQNDWLRMFMVPGMGHCAGGPGPFVFDTLSALEQWREQGAAPQTLMGSNPQSGLQRPLCPYPQSPTYDGSGDLKDADNWSCAVAK